jgi:hypothetical protein
MFEPIMSLITTLIIHDYYCLQSLEKEGLNNCFWTDVVCTQRDYPPPPPRDVERPYVRKLTPTYHYLTLCLSADSSWKTVAMR